MFINIFMEYEENGLVSMFICGQRFVLGMNLLSSVRDRSELLGILSGVR